jgi:nuclear mRNA export protein SAC3
MMQNTEENGRRWAEGTFLTTVREVVKGKTSEADVSVIPPVWRIWVLANPKNDETAIFLQKKFNVPESGTFLTDNVFSIPLAPDKPMPATLDECPGLIVFECEPPESSDDIER